MNRVLVVVILVAVFTGRRRRREQAHHELGDFFVSWIRFEYSLVPSSSGSRVTALARYVTQVAQRDEVFRVEGKRRLEHVARFLEPVLLVERLSVDDVAAHVAGLLRQVFPADEDRLVEVTRFAVLVRQRSEVPTGVLVKLLSQLVDSGRTGH